MSELEREYQAIVKIDKDILTCERGLREEKNPNGIPSWKQHIERLQKDKEFHMKRIRSLRSNYAFFV